MEFKFSEENRSKIERILLKYPEKKPAVMPLLYLAQEQHGWISVEVMKEIASLLGMDEEEVLGVVTFYTMFYKKPMGKYHLQVCTNVSCMLRGGYEILDAVKKKIGLNEKIDVTEDRKFSLEEVECMGSCGTAPMIAVNEDYYENLTIEETEKIIDSLS